MMCAMPRLNRHQAKEPVGHKTRLQLQTEE